MIIGAGMGGLTAACLLAKRGRRVLVLEKNGYPGGYCSNFKRKDYRIESAIHAINGCGSDGRTRQILEECGVASGIRFLEPKDMYRIIFPDLDISFQQKNIPQFSESLSKIFPAESQNIDAFFSEARAIFEETLAPANKPKSALIWKYRDWTLQSFLDSFFKSSRLKAIFSQYWGYLGAPPSQMSAIHYLYMFWDYAANGAFYPEGGSESVATALTENIKQNGGNVIFGAEVSRLISMDGSTLHKVVLKNGDEFAGHNFISNITAKKLFTEMIDGLKVSDNLLNRARAVEGSPSAFVVYLGLNKSMEVPAAGSYEIMINPDYDIEQQYLSALQGDVSNTQMAVTIYSNLDKTCCPAGKSVVSIFMLAGYDWWKKLSHSEYQAQKNRSAELVLKNCERIIPGISDAIDVMEIATPLTLENYSGSTKGALYGWNQDISQASYRRQKPVTPIKNLFLTGAWTRPGGGFSSVVYSGSITADIVNPQISKEVRES